jgi:phosphoglycolate phosphatase
MGEIYAQNWAHKTRPYPGIPELLARLRARGIRLAILSNKPDAFTKDMTAHFFPAGTFDAVMGATKTVPIKPNPAGALILAEQFGLEPAAFAYLGDTNTDMETGLAAGMFTIGVTWGFRPLAELLEAGAQATIDAPDQLPELLR